ncbi:putative sugar O-methyltransferase [Desulfocicer niacini]
MYPLLEMMLSDMEKAPTLYQPTQFWKHGVQSILDDLRCHGVENFRSLNSVLNFFAPKYAFPDYYQNTEAYLQQNKQFVEDRLGYRWGVAAEQFFSGQLQALSDYRVYLATSKDNHPYLDKISESEVGAPVEQFVFEGRYFSRSLLNYLLGINYLKSCFDLEKINTVLEIGGGYGTLGEILLGDARNHCFYINVDIPPTSFVSTFYLKKLFGENNIGDYSRLRDEKGLDIGDLAGRYKGIVICPWQFPKIRGSVDLFVNFISFQEMEPEVVENYFIHVDRLCSKYILLRNLREGKPTAEREGGLGVKMPILGDDYDSLLPNYRLVGTNTIPYAYKTEDGFHSELRVYQKK